MYISIFKIILLCYFIIFSNKIRFNNLKIFYGIKLIDNNKKNVKR